MAQDEWLHVFILLLIVLGVKPRASGMLKCSTIELWPQPLTGGWGVGSLVRDSTRESHPSLLLRECRQGLNH